MQIPRPVPKESHFGGLGWGIGICPTTWWEGEIFFPISDFLFQTLFYPGTLSTLTPSVPLWNSCPWILGYRSEMRPGESNGPERWRSALKVNDEVYERGRSRAVPGDSRIQMFPLKGAEVNLCVKNRETLRLWSWAYPHGHWSCSDNDRKWLAEEGCKPDAKYFKEEMAMATSSVDDSQPWLSKEEGLGKEQSWIMIVESRSKSLKNVNLVSTL